MWQQVKKTILGDEIQGQLPGRVKDAIERQQTQSEILIAWVQVFIVLTFSTLYGLSPKTFSSDAMFAPVPYALAAYGIFTLFRLALAYSGRVGPVFLSLSVVADMVLLMFLIWSFHVQYEQPASFYLKSPTLLYVFIFIALRALRFEAAYVLLAGASAAIGWMILLGYAVFFDDGMTNVTRDYVVYTMSHKILLGAEFDKVISIVVVTLILALVIVRGRKLLINSVAQATAAEDLSRFFSPEIADQITHSEGWIEPGKGEARTAAILHCDLQGFTKLSMERPANEVISLLAEYQSRMVPVIQRHGGTIDKFLGDGILATFGAAVSTDHYAADCLRAMEDLVDEAGHWSRDREEEGKLAMTIRFTSAVGPIVFGAVGDDSRLEYTVIGEPVNLAAKLDKHAKDEKANAVTTRGAVDAAQLQGYLPRAHLETRKSRSVEGVSGTVDLVIISP
ncbi:adenylate/guanylate cyclase domain-containing protein [Sneathiella marina]|uniref:Adenylate/guanylate cyclase domain-containing protein n=1 Tax=Sneathiella marina TaxID=2950108 RepID=A0ABY4W2V0_9PROT|nr:adenylate/guanylate cyclase domain-containing protein [Sneathiella marina]USG61169.1 adenylate/guanylate cyclase domain-containing protein [Sneathiella marina]